jgi:hypothetical protein
LDKRYKIEAPQCFISTALRGELYIVIIRNLGLGLVVIGMTCLLIGLMAMSAPVEKMLEALISYPPGEPVWYVAFGCAALGAGGLIASAQTE